MYKDQSLPRRSSRRSSISSIAAQKFTGPRSLATKSAAPYTFLPTASASELHNMASSLDAVGQAALDAAKAEATAPPPAKPAAGSSSGDAATPTSAAAAEEAAFQAARASLQERILARHERVRKEAEALQALHDELDRAAGPQRDTVEDLRSALEAISLDVEQARTEFGAAKAAVATAESKVQELTETKQALSERLVQILEANEAAKLRKLEELGQRLDTAPPDPAAPAKTPAAPAPAEPEFAGFDESEAAEASWAAVEAASLSSPARGAG